MKNKNLNYYVKGLKKASVGKIVAVVVFCLFFNIINLSAFYKADVYTYTDKNVMMLGDSLSRLYNNINIPVKIVNDLFNESNALKGVENTQVSIKDVYAVIYSKKRLAESASELKSVALSPSGNGAKFLVSDSYLFVVSQYKNLIGNMDGNDFRFLLLFLIIMLMLPRGIPSKIKNMLNIILACPILFFNKIGFFRFYTAGNGGLK